MRKIVLTLLAMSFIAYSCTTDEAVKKEETLGKGGSSFSLFYEKVSSSNPGYVEVTKVSLLKIWQNMLPDINIDILESNLYLESNETEDSLTVYYVTTLGETAEGIGVSIGVGVEEITGGYSLRATGPSIVYTCSGTGICSSSSNYCTLEFDSWGVGNCTPCPAFENSNCTKTSSGSSKKWETVYKNALKDGTIAASDIIN